MATPRKFFLDSLERVIKAKRDHRNNLEHQLVMFQRDTNVLLQNIATWFNHPLVQTCIEELVITEEDVQIDVGSLRISCENRSITITPLSIRSDTISANTGVLNVTGVLSVTVTNPDVQGFPFEFKLLCSNPNETMLNWYCYSNNGLVQFDEEMFFELVGIFAE